MLGFVGFALAGLGVEAETLDTVLYALAAGSYLVFVGYTLAAFERPAELEDPTLVVTSQPRPTPV